MSVPVESGAAVCLPLIRKCDIAGCCQRIQARNENNHLFLRFKSFFIPPPALISLLPCAPFRYRHTLSLGSVAIMCGFCKPPQSLEATKGCADCKSNFCNACFKLYHPWGTPRAQHEHILPTNNFRPKVCLPSTLLLLFQHHGSFVVFLLQVLTCTEHEQERMQWHCHSCQRLLCPLCKLQRVHHGHKVLPIAQAYQDLKVNQSELSRLYHHVFCSPAFLCLFQDKVTKEVNFILANQETIQSQITHLDDAIKQMEVNVFDFFTYLCKALETEGAL